MNPARWKLGLYNAFLVAGAPLLLLKKAIKFGRRGHQHEWDLARWTAPHLAEIAAENNAKSGQKRVVLVALSWGEVGILAQLTARLEGELSGLKILWSIRDRAAQGMARRQFPGREIVAMPFDFSVPTRNWLSAVRPDVLILVEKFWWPNLIWGAKLRGAQVILVNGRSRGREKTRYKWGSGFQKWVLSGLDALLFESQAQIERVREVLPRGAILAATGNVKFAFTAPITSSATTPSVGALQAWLAGVQAPLFIAGSTSPIDEKWALDAFETARKSGPCALLLAPRRVERAGEVAREIEARGLSLSCRSAFSDNASQSALSKVAASKSAASHGAASENAFSKSENAFSKVASGQDALSGGELTGETGGAEVFLLDTLGELFGAYQFGTAAYVGGSVEGRGHNIIEPLAHGLAVSYGPLRGDFEAAQRVAEEFEVGFRLRDAGELAQFWARSRDADFRREIQARAADLLATQRGSLDATVAILKELLC